VSVRLEEGDCLEVIPRLVAEGIICDACVCDPPYHLVAISERSKYPVKHGRDGAMKHLLGGFMNQTWDGGDIAFRPETWAAVATILRPGAFLLAFSGTRTYHRMVSAIEDAGFVIQDQILSMVASDARVRSFAETLTPGQLEAFSAILDQMQFAGSAAWAYGSGFPKRCDALKPAFEPIVVAYKPGGARTLQIDECRIECQDKTPFPVGATSIDGVIDTGLHSKPRAGDDNPLGRYPANIIHDGSDEVLAAFPDTGQSGVAIQRNGGGQSIWGSRNNLGSRDDVGFNDAGSAARFFYEAKASATDRWHSKHPTVKPISLISYLVKLVCPPGGTFLDPFAGSGTGGAAAINTGRSAILIEREPQYAADIRERLASYKGESSLPAPKRKNRRKEDGIFDMLEE
jgi:site-specific DNA-methyltransferase (adenine-specific)